MHKKYLLGLFVVVGLFSVSYGVFGQTFSDPACPPPGCNSYAPISVGPTPQFKAGNLTIYSPTVTGTIASDILHVRGGALINSSNTPSGKALLVPFGHIGLGTESPDPAYTVDIRGSLGFGGNVIPKIELGKPDAGGPIHRTEGLLGVAGNIVMNPGILGKRFDMRYSGFLGGGEGGSLQTFNGTITQGDISILPDLSFGKAPTGDEGNIYMKSGARQGSVIVGNDGFQTLRVYGDINATAKPSPAWAYILDPYDAPNPVKDENVAINHNTPLASIAWPAAWNGANRMTCDVSVTSTNCGSSIPGTAGGLGYRYDIYIKAEGAVGTNCGVPPSGNSSCTFTAYAYRYYLAPAAGALEGGSIFGSNLFADRGSFTGSVEAENLTVSKIVQVGDALRVGGTNGILLRDNGDAQLGKDFKVTSSTIDIAGKNLIVDRGDIHTKNLLVSSDTIILGTLIPVRMCLGGVCHTSWPTSTTPGPGPGPGGGVTGTGAVNRMAVWTGTSTVGPSNLREAGTVLSTGGVFGVGTNSPEVTRALTIQPPAGQFGWLQLKDNTGANKWHITGFANGLNISETGVADRFFIAAGGNIGIGKTNPNATLEVKGDVKITSTGADNVAFHFEPNAGRLTVGSPTQSGKIYVTRNSIPTIQIDGNSGKVNAGQFCDINGNNCITPGGAGGGGLGNWTTIGNGWVVNNAPTDGFVLVRFKQVFGGGGQSVPCSASIESPVGTVRQQTDLPTSGVVLTDSLMAPIKKGDGWKMVTTCAGSNGYYWIPMGN
ncbi:MAG: hypothetical protein AAB691_04580 [Patescibacteria group bacterium]